VKRSILGVLLVLTFVAVGIAAAPQLTFTFSDVHANKTATETDSYGINSSGAIAGDYVDASSVQHGMILAGKKLTTINNKNCQTTGGKAGSISFFGINSAGAAVGWCLDINTGMDDAFLYAKGKMTPIKFPKSMGTQATGINDKGDVAGLYFDASGIQHGFLKLAKGKYKDLTVTGATSTAAWGINNKRLVTLEVVNSSNLFDSYLFNGKSFKKINVPGATQTIVHTNNNVGDIVYTIFDSAGAGHGVLFHKGKYFQFDDPNSTNSTRGDGLNDKLVMVGRYTPSAGGNFGFKVIAK